MTPAAGRTGNAAFLDFALRVGFDVRFCRAYRAQTKGRVESGIKDVKHTSGRRLSSKAAWISTAKRTLE